MKTPAPERAAGRRKLAAQGDALPSGTAPIPDVAYLKKAIKAVGRVDPAKRPALKALIRRRAKELGALNTPGVKGTWAFQGSNGSEIVKYAESFLGVPYRFGAVELARPGRMPAIRGASDVRMAYDGKGGITVTHKPTEMKVGSMSPTGPGYGAKHADGTVTPASGSQQGALAGLIRYHNQMAARKNARAAATTGSPAARAMRPMTYAGEQQALDLAMAVPASSASDGPRMTVMSGGKSSAAAPGLSPECARVYAKLRKKGLSPKAALSMARRAAAMHAKAGAGPKASAAGRAA